jgi:gamma-glutamyltranspeptidase
LDLFGQPNTLSRSSVTEILKLSMADRDEYYADPRFADVPLAELLSDEVCYYTTQPLAELYEGCRLVLKVS